MHQKTKTNKNEQKHPPPPRKKRRTHFVMNPQDWFFSKVCFFTYKSENDECLL